MTAIETVSSSQPNVASKKAGKFPFFAARNWQGMTLPIWLRLLTRHRFAISPSRLPQALRITLFSLANSGLAWWEKVLYGEQINATQLGQPPLFVIGHWRTGTTWLHELLAQDDRFTYPSTYQCMAPHHFLSTQDEAPVLMPHLLPAQRPMDNMTVGWNRPQEDEFALCNLGLLSPYLLWAFPNERDRYAKYLDMEDIPRHEKRRWQKTMLRFLQHLTCFDNRRIVLKSPTHTARIATLLEVLPDAQFIHIVRDPYVIFPSTIKTWKRLWDVMSLQVPRFHNIEEYVFENFLRMYRCFNRDKTLLKPQQLYEVRYEDLRRDIVGEMRKIYDHLGLGDFEDVELKLQKYMNETSDYKTNRFEIGADLRKQIATRWGEYIRQYGYEKE